MEVSGWGREQPTPARGCRVEGEGLTHTAGGSGLRMQGPPEQPVPTFPLFALQSPERTSGGGEDPAKAAERDSKGPARKGKGRHAWRVWRCGEEGTGAPEFKLCFLHLLAGGSWSDLTWSQFPHL